MRDFAILSLSESEETSRGNGLKLAPYRSADGLYLENVQIRSTKSESRNNIE